MGIITNSIPTWLAGALQREFTLSAFVESGLAQGTTARWAERKFRTCISIEIDNALVCQFHARYPNSAVDVWCGNSGLDMFFAVREIDTPALFWLDGHTDDDCPVMDELAAINASAIEHLIMIDDARLFGSIAAWPPLAQVCDAAQLATRRALFFIDDVIVAVPVAMAARVGRIIEKR